MQLELQSKFNLMMTVVFVCVTTAAWFFSARIISVVNAQWATLFSQRQVQFDKHRTLMPLIREIALARQLALEPSLLAMTKTENNAKAQQDAIEVLERYRKNFRDQSYFFVVASSGNYYFNDADNTYAGKQKRYQLSPNKPADQWFYATVKNGNPYQVNLDPDANLGVTKVWINVLIEDEGKVVGMVGTGIDITTFLRETVDVGHPGVHNLFVDRDMAIQLYRDASLIDYASITKNVKERSRVDALLTNPKDIDLLSQAMHRVEKAHYTIETIEVTFQGRRHLLGVAYLPEIGWFDLTLMDTKGLFMIEDFLMIPIVLTSLFLSAILALGYLLNRAVIKPIAALNQATLKIEQGDFDLPSQFDGEGKDEIGDVSRAFRHMAASLQEYTANLEAKVAERTLQLEAATESLRVANQDLNRLSRTDSLTKLRNRHDLVECLHVEESRAKRTGQACGVVIMDFDHFKSINDTHGHNAGDEVLRSVTQAIAENLRTEDVFGRWGGEEFLLLCPGNGVQETLRVAEKIRELVEKLAIRFDHKIIPVTISQGVTAYLPGAPVDIEACVRNADMALYNAKDGGRNQVVVYKAP